MKPAHKVPRTASLRAWVAERFTQVKDETAQRAGDTEQNALPPKLLAIVALLACSAAQALDLNQATEADLDGVKGLGPSTTARILAARQAQPFKNWQDFMQRVKGIKAATAAKLATAGLTIEGAGYAATETLSAAANSRTTTTPTATNAALSATAFTALPAPVTAPSPKPAP